MLKIYKDLWMTNSSRIKSFEIQNKVLTVVRLQIFILQKYLKQAVDILLMVRYITDESKFFSDDSDEE